MFGHCARVGAAIVGHQHAGAPRGIQIHMVVSGAEQLRQPQPRRRAEERLVHGIDVADQVLGVGQRGGVAGTAGGAHDQFEARRRHLLRLLHRLLKRVDQQDFVGMRFLPGSTERSNPPPAPGRGDCFAPLSMTDCATRLRGLWRRFSRRSSAPECLGSRTAPSASATRRTLAAPQHRSPARWGSVTAMRSEGSPMRHDPHGCQVPFTRFRRCASSSVSSAASSSAVYSVPTA